MATVVRATATTQRHPVHATYAAYVRADRQHFWVRFLSESDTALRTLIIMHEDP